jgi:hypothetical protein
LVRGINVNALRQLRQYRGLLGGRQGAESRDAQLGELDANIRERLRVDVEKCLAGHEKSFTDMVLHPKLVHAIMSIDTSGPHTASIRRRFAM